MKKLLIAILLVLTILIFISQQNEIDYFEYGPIKWEEFKEIEMKPYVYDITKSIKVENIELTEEKVKELFPINETWPAKKYLNANNYFNNFYYEKNEYLFYLVIDGINVLNKFNKQKKLLIDFSMYEDKRKELNNYALRLIDVKGPWITIMGWKNGDTDDVVDSIRAYIFVYQFNIITKQVFIYHSFFNGIFVYPDRISSTGYSSFWEISKDHRYLYLAGARTPDGLTGKWIVESEPPVQQYVVYEFDETQYKVNPGVYALDLLKWRIYKLANAYEGKGVEMLCNNIEDGYFYYNILINWNGNNKYYRFKNAEEIMTKHR